jgi:hypothetical protein
MDLTFQAESLAFKAGFNTGVGAGGLGIPGLRRAARDSDALD